MDAEDIENTDEEKKKQEELNLKLLQAIKNADIILVNQLIQEGADIWYRDDQVYDYLLEEGCRAELIFDGKKLLDSENNGVMMGWEQLLMEKHAEILCLRENLIENNEIDETNETNEINQINEINEINENVIELNILNIGFGLGLIDSAIQKYKPTLHTIIEAHPDVYKFMIEQGWDKKPGVKIIFGKWQEVLINNNNQLLEEEGEEQVLYDGIFFDTFGEYYKDLKEFNEEVVINYLKPNGIYSFFNGLGATNSFFHDVYCKIVEMHLAELGLEINFIEIPLDEIFNDEKECERIWEGVKRRYWNLNLYRLPICKFMI
ncbi:10381_t:CDS:2 [Diversispora eburnea]|uniref:10381_t:CDS:1 n=1 Tax=Diversispora eburnea TaxID=1213867 RepID=A0A9N9G4I0_9GLOM|nr:10381_t:CDS:2 [Diversispora eburnea]